MRFALALAVLLSVTSARAATRFALVLGNNIGGPQDGALKWAAEDARRIHALLTELGGVMEGRAILLTDADMKRVRLELARLRGQIEEASRQGYRTELFVFYSGHGDAESLHLGYERLALAELAAELQRVPADATVTIIDACRSGALKRGRGKGVEHAPAFDISLAREIGPAGRVTITSAGRDEVAQESDELRGSFFTHHMVSGLRGAADNDHDGTVTLAELYRYAYNHTLASSHGETAAVQHPEMSVALEGEGELVMTVLNRARSTLILPADTEGSFLVIDDRSSRVIAEVQKPRGASRALALPSGRYRVQLRRDGRIYAGEVALDWGGRREVTAGMLREQPLVAALEKGSDLDPAPWSVGLLGTGGSASALGSALAMGGAAQLERRLSALPLLGVVTLELSRAFERNEAWRYTHLETRLGIGVGYPYFLGSLELRAALTLGPVMIYELARRTEARRMEAMGITGVTASSATVGLFVAPTLEVRVPLYESLSAALAGSIDTAWLEIDGETRNVSGLRGALGLHYEF